MAVIHVDTRCLFLLVVETHGHATVERIGRARVLAGVRAGVHARRVERLADVHLAELDLVPHVVELDLDPDAAAPAHVHRNATR